MKRKPTQSEKLARKTATANRVNRKLSGSVGSPYRIHEAVRNHGKPIPNNQTKGKAMTKQCPRCGSSMTCGAPHVPGPVVQWECGNCGKVIVEDANPS